MEFFIILEIYSKISARVDKKYYRKWTFFCWTACTNPTCPA